MYKWALGILAAASVVAGLALLWCLDPSKVRLYPGCPFLLLTGLYCPSCGGIRAVHALMHGRLAEAAGYNVFLLFSVPMLAITYYVHKKGHTHRVSMVLLLFWGITGLAFWIARNLPMEPFTWLAP